MDDSQSPQPEGMEPFEDLASRPQPRKTLSWAVCVDGALVTRERAAEWPVGDPLRGIVLRWEDMTERGDAEYGGGPIRATRLAAALKMADPDALVTVAVWEASDG